MASHTEIVTDFDLVYAAKINNCSESKLALLSRYDPLICKLYFYKMSSQSKNFISLEDFRQESYFLIEEAINYVNIDKLYDRKKWKFLFIFTWILMTFIIKQNKKSRRLYTCDSDCFDMEAYGELVHIKTDDTINQIEVFVFRDSLNQFERIIFDERYGYGAEVKDMRSIAAENGKSKSWVNLVDKKVLEKWKKYKDS